jgi:hypothetical protein
VLFRSKIFYEENIYFGTIMLLSLIFSATLLTSCSSSDDSKNNGGPDDDNNPPSSKQLSLTTNATTVIVNEEVAFYVKMNNENVEGATILINDQAIEGTKHIFAETGEYKVIAKKEGLESSNEIKINVVEDQSVIDNATKFKHRTLVEDFTGAWCQYCPLVAYDIDQLEASDSDKFQAIAIHVNDQGPDPFAINHSARKKFNYEFDDFTGWPFAMTDRKINFRESPNSPIARHKTFSPIGVRINSSLQSTFGAINISIKFGEDFNKPLKYAVFVLEDGLVYEQVNTTQYYKNAPWVYEYPYTKNFIHNNTLRAMFDGGFRGSEIPASLTKQGKEFTNSDITMTYKSENIDNLKVVVIVTDGNSGEVLNTVVAKGNTDQNYEVVL